MNTYVIVVGNPIDGINLIGPFTDVDEPNEYAERHVRDEWWVVEVRQPEKEAED